MSYELSERPIVSSDRQLEYAQKRRDANRVASRCINHNKRPAVIGCRCSECWWIHRYGTTVTIASRIDALLYDLRRIADA